MLPRPFYHWTTYPGHGGIDYPRPRNTPVMASGPGVIDWSGYYSARGGYAKFITYDNGERWGYYHFDREAGLLAGTRVEYGTEFAYVGSLGQLSTGPHLHHEVWQGRSSITRPPAYWDHVDKYSYVGDGKPAGGDSRPFPTPDQEEDDMFTDEDRERLNAVYAAIFGPKNLAPDAPSQPLWWANNDGSVQSSNYGILPILLHNQDLIAKTEQQTR